MGDKTHIKVWDRALPPGISETIPLIETPVHFGKGAAQNYPFFWVDIAFQTDEATGTQTVTLNKSGDGGETFDEVEVVAVGLGHTLVSFFVSPYRDWQIVYHNGDVAQGSFSVDFVIDHNSRGNPA